MHITVTAQDANLQPLSHILPHRPPLTACRPPSSTRRSPCHFQARVRRQHRRGCSCSPWLGTQQHSSADIFRSPISLLPLSASSVSLLNIYFFLRTCGWGRGVLFCTASCAFLLPLLLTFGASSGALRPLRYWGGHGVASSTGNPQWPRAPESLTNYQSP